mmetsp:Transcript_12171/g.33777  ORF Transcript_12171/g.33777 Transcript_12171/m.33777 type:complete len:90 (-) Transcript_12171:1606-1875(-)
MSKVTLGTRVLDALQRTTVLGLISYCGFEIWQINKNVRDFSLDSPHKHSTYFEDTEQKVKEESDTGVGNDYLDRYRDEEYLKSQVKANK